MYVGTCRRWVPCVHAARDLNNLHGTKLHVHSYDMNKCITQAGSEFTLIHHSSLRKIRQIMCSHMIATCVDNFQECAAACLV